MLQAAMAWDYVPTSMSVACLMRIAFMGAGARQELSRQRANRMACNTAKEQGANVTVIRGEYLASLPHYRVAGACPDAGKEMVEAALPERTLARESVRR